MNERELTGMMQRLDRPRRPRPEFEQALREELFGGDVAYGADGIADVQVSELAGVDELEQPRARRLARRAILVGVAATATAIICLTVLLTRDGERTQVSVVSKPSVVSACQTFSATAYRPLNRTKLLGDFNSQYLTDVPTTRARTETLRAALAFFSSELQRAGFKDARTVNALTTAEGFATRALTQLDEGSVLNAADSLKEIGSQLDTAQIALTRLGIASCF